VRGAVELGVKAFVDRAALDRSVAARSPEVAELDAAIAAAGAGHGYLLARRREQLAREESSRLIAAFAADAHARLATCALDAVVNVVQPPELSGRPEQMVLNGAYLVRIADDDFEKELEKLERDAAELGIALERTGPWPPYNFVPRELRAE
jgi:Gas vesicle synthesis protein GvpL/GvpF